MYAIPYIVLMRLHRLALDARRKDRTWRYYAYSLASGLLAVFLAAVAFLVAYAMWRIDLWWLGLALLVMFALPPLQPLVSRHLLVPLGLVRTSYWFAHFVSMDDSDAYGLTCAAWAHSMKPTPEGEAWLVARRDRRVPLGDAEIVVTALLVAGRDDADTARMLMRSTAMMVESHPLVRELVGEWLAVDAAERGAWAELDADARRATWPASALTFFLEAIAKKHVDHEFPPTPLELYARWLMAPHRRATRALLRAIATVPAPPTSPATTATTDSGSASDASATTGEPATTPAPLQVPLHRAVAAHLTLATAPRASAETLAIAVRAWDSALVDAETQAWLARRALELDAPLGAVDRALRDVATAVTDELSRLADTASLASPGGNGPVGVALTRRLRHGRLDALESGFARWEDRRHAGAVHAPIDEWREFVALRAAYEAAVSTGGLDLRRLAFPHAYSKGTSMAVWLWNTRNEYALSHAISRWLLDEALVVGDTEAIELCTRNTRLTVPTRTGDVIARPG